MGIRLISGKILQFGVDPRDNVIELKKMLESDEGIPIDQQRLFFEEKLVKDIDKDTKQPTLLGSFPNRAVLKLMRPAPKLAYSKNKSPSDKFAAKVKSTRTED